MRTHRPSRTTGLLCLTAIAGCAPAPGGVAPARGAGSGASGGITAADLRSRLYAYADDSMLGREAGKIGDFKATTYIAAEAKRLGLEPAGENGGYFQVLPLTRLELDPSTSISAGGRPLELWKDYAPLPPIQRIPVALTGRIDVPVIYGGRLGDTVATITPEQAAGKVVVLGPAIGPAGKPVFGLNPRAFAAFPGAAAIAFANFDYAPPGVVDFLRNTPPLMGDGPAPDAGPRPLALFVTSAAAERMLGSSLEAVQVGATAPALAGTLGFRTGTPEAPARNVVAILRGSDPALRDEYVAIGAHNDHIGISRPVPDHDSLWVFNRVMRPQGAETNPGQPTPEQADRMKTMLDSLRKIGPSKPDSIRNGADDDGSGTVSVLEIAQAFATARPRPKRSILFVWHTGEEKGLWGSTWYTDHPTVPRDSIVAQLNIDMVGRGNADDLPGGGPDYLQLVGSRRLSTELGDLVERVNTEGKHGMAFDYQYDADGHPENIYCRSDHYSYARYGIPIVFFTTGVHPDYHMYTDEPQYINYEKMARVDRLIYDVARTVADLDHRVVVDKPKPDPKGQCKQ